MALQKKTETKTEKPSEEKKPEVVPPTAKAPEKAREAQKQEAVEQRKAFQKQELGKEYWQETFQMLGEALTKLLQVIQQYFGKNVFSTETQNVEEVASDPEKAKEALKKANLDANKLTIIGRKLGILWPPKGTAGLCTIEYGTKRTTGKRFHTDTNGLQSIGHFQFNGPLMQNFFKNVADTGLHKKYLKGETLRKFLSIASHGQKVANIKRGPKKRILELTDVNNNLLTDEQGNEIARMIAENPELGYNFRAETLFGKNGAIPRQTRKLKSEFPGMEAFIGKLAVHSPYIATWVDLINQCGESGGTRVIRDILQALKDKGTTDPHPITVLTLLVESSSKRFGKNRVFRTFHSFVTGVASEAAVPKKVKELAEDFLTASAERKKQIFTAFEGRMKPPIEVAAAKKVPASKPETTPL